MYLLCEMTVMLYGCSSSMENSSSKTTKFPLGRELYYSKCSSCHRVYEREMFKPAEWEKIINEMASKAKLTKAEKQNLLNYLNEE